MKQLTENEQELIVVKIADEGIKDGRDCYFAGGVFSSQEELEQTKDILINVFEHKVKTGFNNTREEFLTGELGLYLTSYEDGLDIGFASARDELLQEDVDDEWGMRPTEYDRLNNKLGYFLWYVFPGLRRLYSNAWRRGWRAGRRCGGESEGEG